MNLRILRDWPAGCGAAQNSKYAIKRIALNPTTTSGRFPRTVLRPTQPQSFRALCIYSVHTTMSYTPIPTEEEAEQDVAMSLQRNRHSPATTFQTPHSLERSSDFLLPLHDKSGRSSIASTANTSPSHSRAASPSPLFLSAAPRASSSSDTESDSNSPLLLHSGRPRWSEDTPSRSRWWPVSSARRNRPGHSNSYVRAVKRGVRRVSRHPFVPKQPIMIVRLNHSDLTV